ncbi:MAG: glutathione peroxidase [Nitrospirales bacterium]|nr:glutathione peroxidase [Nitrospirales bacterium]
MDSCQKIRLSPWHLYLLVFCLVFPACGQEYASSVDEAMAKEPTKIFDFTMDDIDGNPVPLSTYKGKVIMVVNTASFCGNTPQYGGLQTLYEQYRDQGFTVLAFPANDFGEQEPGTDKEIAEFCYTKYALEFPLFSKITVLGENKHPLYRYLTEDTPFKGEIKWNFQKFLIDRSGNVIARYRPGMKPLTPQIVEDIEKALIET